MMASALLSGAPPARRGAGHPRPDGKAEEEPIVELSATTTTQPAGMRGPASPAVLWPGPLSLAGSGEVAQQRPRHRPAGAQPGRPVDGNSLLVVADAQAVAEDGDLPDAAEQPPQ